MPFYREEIEKHYYCAKCGKEIKGKARKERICFERIILDGDRIVPILGSGFRDRGIYLCPKCVKDFKKFIKNEYPLEQSEREKILEDKLRQVAEEFSQYIESVSLSLSIISNFSKRLNDRINDSPYSNEKEDEHQYLLSKLEILRFINGINGKSEESED